MRDYRHWSEDDDSRLIELMLKGLTRREIAAEIDRTFRAVKHRLCRREPRGGVA
jgi:hypothetical protein